MLVVLNGEQIKNSKILLEKLDKKNHFSKFKDKSQNTGLIISDQQKSYKILKNHIYQIEQINHQKKFVAEKKILIVIGGKILKYIQITIENLQTKLKKNT